MRRLLRAPTVRALLMITAIALVSACSDDGIDQTTTTTEATPTTVQSTPTSSSPDTTTTEASTSTTSHAIDGDPFLPSALDGDMVPWDQVGDGWYVVLYDSSKAAPSSQADVRIGTEVLYLVSSNGDRYRVASWEGGNYSTLVDATASTALIVRTGSNVDETVYELIEFATNAASIVYTVGFPESSYVSAWPQASLTRPTGTNVVVHRSDGSVEWLERRNRDGEVLSVVYEQPLDERRGLGWLYGTDGTSLVVAHTGGLELVSNEGQPLRALWAPDDTHCDPVRWWDADRFLTVCFGNGPDSAPLDDQGQPHTYYGKLWLIPDDGTAGTALTTYPDEPVMVVDFGYHDAWPTDEGTFLQWYGDCGAAGVAELAPDGTAEFLEVVSGPGFLADGVGMIDIADGRIALYGWLGCDASVGELFMVDVDGAYSETLVPVVDDARGVVGVVGLETLYP